MRAVLIVPLPPDVRNYIFVHIVGNLILRFCKVNLSATIIEWLILFIQIKSRITVTFRNVSWCQCFTIPAVGTQHTLFCVQQWIQSRTEVINILLTAIYFYSNWVSVAESLRSWHLPS